MPDPTPHTLVLDPDSGPTARAWRTRSSTRLPSRSTPAADSAALRALRGDANSVDLSAVRGDDELIDHFAAGKLPPGVDPLVQPLAKWVREVGTEPAGGVAAQLGGGRAAHADRPLRRLDALAEHRAELRVEVVALLGFSLGVEKK